MWRIDSLSVVAFVGVAAVVTVVAVVVVVHSVGRTPNMRYILGSQL
jgi:hypothetical protein